MALMITGAVVFAVGAFFGAVMVAVGEQLEQEPAAIIGTDSEYGAYVELGTGIYAEGGGRPTPWVYQDAKGNWHYTRGNKAQPFLKPALADHAQQYRDILVNELKNG